MSHTSVPITIVNSILSANKQCDPHTAEPFCRCPTTDRAFWQSGITRPEVPGL